MGLFMGLKGYGVKGYMNILYYPQWRPQDADLSVTVYSDLRKDFR